MIDKKRLVEIMNYVVKQYPDGCNVDKWDEDLETNLILRGRMEIDDSIIIKLINETLDEFIHEDLKIMTCGYPINTWVMLAKILETYANEDWDLKVEAILLNEFKDGTEVNQHARGLMQFAIYILDSHDFIELSSHIWSGHITEKGRYFLDILKMKIDL